MYTLEGVSSVANFITAYEESQSNRDSHFPIRSVFFVSKGNLFDVNLHFNPNQVKGLTFTSDIIEALGLRLLIL